MKGSYIYTGKGYFMATYQVNSRRVKEGARPLRSGSAARRGDHIDLEQLPWGSLAPIAHRAARGASSRMSQTSAIAVQSSRSARKT